MRLPHAAAFVGLAIVGGTAHADGDALVDMLGPREIAVGEAMRGGASGATAIPLNPAGLPLTRDVVFEGGYGYRASDQASLIGVSACDSTAAMPGCFYYDYAGASPSEVGSAMIGHTTTHIGGASLAYPVSPRVFLGTNVKYFHFDSDMASAPSASGFNEDIGTTVRVTDIFNVGVAGYNLFGTESVQFPRAVGGGVFARPIPNLALSFDSRWLTSGAGARYGGGAELFLRTNNGQTGIPLRAGALHDSGLGATYISAGLGLAGLKYGIDVAARRAISGADDTMVIASMRFYGPRLRGPSADAEE
jgi:hypothetical protein